MALPRLVFHRSASDIPAFYTKSPEMFVFKPTSKGLLRAEFKDRLGATCALQESSRADEDCAWLGVEVDLDGDEIRYGKMLITRDMAEKLLPVLRHFARTGHLGQDTPGQRFEVGTWVVGVGVENHGIEGRVIATGETVVIQDYTHPGKTHSIAWDHIELHWEPQERVESVPTRYDRIIDNDD